MDKQQLAAAIKLHFTLTELRQLYFDLNLRFEDIRGETVTDKAIGLVELCLRDNQMDRLVAALTAVRPRVPWSWVGIQMSAGQYAINLDELYAAATRDALYGSFHDALQKIDQIGSINPFYHGLARLRADVERAMSPLEVAKPTYAAPRPRFNPVFVWPIVLIVVGIVSWIALYDPKPPPNSLSQEPTRTPIAIIANVTSIMTSTRKSATRQATPIKTPSILNASPTSTQTGTPIFTITPIPANIPTKYFGFKLTFPPPETFISSSEAEQTFHWQWERQLQEDEHFEIRFYRPGETTYQAPFGWSKEPYRKINLNQLSGGGHYEWAVVVVKGVDGRWEQDLIQSERYELFWEG
ncbi:MAG: hypothetical protein H6667_00600 [Ardenticatenaceae bacterium]|nr:hypothetical protein [Ardenticatenaceae bacterium]